MDLSLFRESTPTLKENWTETIHQHVSGALLKLGLRVQLWSHLGCDGRDESGCKLTGNEGLYKRTWRIYKSPDNPHTGQLSLQGTESTEWIWTWNALQKPMFFGFFSWSINIFVLQLLNIYPHCLPARSPNPSQKTDLKKGRKGQERTILFEPCLQFPGDFCPFSSCFPCAAAGRWDGHVILHRQKNWLLSLPLPPSNMGWLQMQLWAPNTIPGQSQLGNVRQFAAKHCTLSKHCTSNKACDFSYTQHVIWRQHSPNLLLAWLQFIFHSFGKSPNVI